MTFRRHLVLRLLAAQERYGWCRPRHLGGTISSWHSRELRRLVKERYAKRRVAFPGEKRPTHEYRITRAGKGYLKKTPRPTKEMTDGRRHNGGRPEPR